MRKGRQGWKETPPAERGGKFPMTTANILTPDPGTKLENPVRNGYPGFQARNGSVLPTFQKGGVAHDPAGHNEQ